MNVAMSSTATPAEMAVSRTGFAADSTWAVQVFLVGSHTSMYLSVDEARTLGERLLAAADAEVTA